MNLIRRFLPSDVTGLGVAELGSVSVVAQGAGRRDTPHGEELSPTGFVSIAISSVGRRRPSSSWAS